AVMYQAGLYTIRGTFSGGGVTWKDVSDAPLTNSASEDAILAVDRATGRTFVSQLALACSIGAVSDDDGASWTPAAKACQTPPGPTVPRASPSPGTTARRGPCTRSTTATCATSTPATRRSASARAAPSTTATATATAIQRSPSARTTARPAAGRSTSAGPWAS